MTRSLILTNGSISVDLVGGNPGYSVRASPAAFPAGRHARNSSLLADGDVPAFLSEENVVEIYRVRLMSTSHDLVAGYLQDLADLRKAAQDGRRSRWRASPVYLEARALNETGTRYSQVHIIEVPGAGDYYDYDFEKSNVIPEITIAVEREPYWRSTAPGSLPAALSLSGVMTGQPDQTEQQVGNVECAITIDYVFTYDASAATFSSNLAGSAAGFDLLPDPPAAGDMLYIGADTPFPSIAFKLATLGAGITGSWQYSQAGPAWATALCSDGPDDWTGYNAAAGQYMLVLDDVTTWAAVSINGQSAYWLRYNVASVSSPTAPVQATQAVFPIIANYAKMDCCTVTGDRDALLRLWFRMKFDPTQTGQDDSVPVGEIICGYKTRGLSNFRSHINLGTADSGWSLAYGTDTASATNTNAPNGTVAQCTFTASTALVSRVAATYTSANANDFVGEYQVFMRCYQLTGSAGDVSVQLQVNVNSTLIAWTGDTVALTAVGSVAQEDDWEVVNLGRISIPFIRDAYGLVADQTILVDNIVFSVLASATSSTPDLYLCDLVLIPVDEGAWRVHLPDRASGTVAGLYEEFALVVDGGINAAGAQLIDDYTANNPFIDWVLASAPPRMPVQIAVHFYFLFIQQRYTAGTLFSSPNYATHVSMYVHQLYSSLRGAA